MSIRLVLAEDNFLLREGVHRLLDAQPDIDLVAVCAEYDELIRAIDHDEPDVVLTDIRMPPGHFDEGVRAAAYARDRSPEVGVVLLSQYVEASYVHALLAHGTDRRGYLLKERVAEVDELVRALKEVASGGSAIDPKVIEALVQTLDEDGKRELGRLTRREYDVLAAMAQGKSNATIAGDLFLSQRAVEKHINAIFAKLGLSGDRHAHPRVSAVLLFLSQGNATKDSTIA